MDQYFGQKVLLHESLSSRNKTEQKVAFKENCKHSLCVQLYARLENSTSEGSDHVVIWQRVIHLLPQSFAV